MKRLHFAGYDFDVGPEGTRIVRGTLPKYPGTDYGCDPLQDGTFRMVPSGDIVSCEEKELRLTPMKG